LKNPWGRQQRLADETMASEYSGRSSFETVVGSAPSNAISTLLNDPRLRNTASKPTAREIPPVTLTNIPSVKASEFASYLSEVTSEYERYAHAKNLEVKSFLRHNRRDSIRLSRTPLSPGGNDRRDSFPQVLSMSSPTSIQSQRFSRDSTPINENPLSPSASFSRRTHSRQASAASIPHDYFERQNNRRTSANFNNIASVPKFFFDESFRLENPRTFDVVSERGLVAEKNDNANRKSLASNAILQEKLSWYMDIVEIHLIEEISLASSSFFSALGELQDLRQQAVQCLETIEQIRQGLKRVDEEQVDTALVIYKVQRRHTNVTKLKNAVSAIKSAVGQTKNCEDLLTEGKLFDALESMESAQSQFLSVNGAAEGNMQTLPAIGTTLNRLRNISGQIGKAMQSRFSGILMADITSWVEKADKNETIRRLKSHGKRGERGLRISMEYQHLPESLREELQTHLGGLVRTSTVDAAISQYRDATLRQIKSLIKQALPNESDVDSTMSGMTNRSTGQKSALLARGLRIMPPQEFNDMLLDIYTSVSETLRRMSAQQKLLLDLTSSIVTTPAVNGRLTNGSSTPQQRSSLEFTDLILVNAETAQARMSRIISVRVEQNCRMATDSFIRFYNLNTSFVAECEAITGSIGTSLQNAIAVQARQFLESYQGENLKLLNAQIDRDQWSAEKVSQRTQEIGNHILSAATRDGEEYVQVGRIDMPDFYKQPSDAPDNATIFLEDERFFLTASSAFMLRTIEEYEILAMNLPQSQDIVPKMMECLRLFNSRTCQVILGAGATRSAGLKNIVARHLALASQSLNLVINLIPYIREYMRRHASSGSVGEFDKLKRAFQDHQNEIHAKLKSIMSDRLNAHCKTLHHYISGQLSWTMDGAPAKPHPYMESLVKDTTRMHDVLKRFLPEAVVVDIMSSVFQGYQVRLGEEYSHIDMDATVKRTLLSDVIFFKARTAGLTGIGKCGQELVDGVQGQQLRRSAENDPKRVVEEKPVQPQASKEKPTDAPQAFKENPADEPQASKEKPTDAPQAIKENPADEPQASKEQPTEIPAEERPAGEDTTGSERPTSEPADEPNLEQEYHALGREMTGTTDGQIVEEEKEDKPRDSEEVD